MKRKGTVTVFVLLLVALGQFAIDVYLPSLPSIQLLLNTTKSAAQLTLTFFLIGFGFSQLVYGPFSERYGRRKILLIGLAIFILSAMGASLAPTIHFLIVMRLIQGLGIGAANVLCRAILRDLYEGKELAKKITLLSIIWVSSPIIAPVIGGYIEEFLGWRMNFVFLALIVACMWIWGFLFLPETKDPSQQHSIHPRTIGKNYFTLLAHRPFMGYVLTTFFLYGIFTTFYVSGPFLLQNVLGLTPVAFGWMMLIISCGYMIGSSLNMYLIHHLEQMTVIKIGLVGILTLSIAMLVTAFLGIFNTSAIVIPMTILFWAIALIYPNCIGLGLSIFPHLAGSASAVWGFFTYLGATLATIAMSLFSEKTQMPLVLAILVQSVFAGLVVRNKNF